MSEIREHVADEEQNLLPQLRAACSPERLDELGDKVRQAKKAAPTRPHPAAPDKPPANKLPAPGAGMVDRLRDALSGRGKLGWKTAGEGPSRQGRALRRARSL